MLKRISPLSANPLRSSGERSIKVFRDVRRSFGSAHLTLGKRGLGLILLFLMGMALAGGCTRSGEYLSSERWDKGLVMILPGIGGKSPISRDIGRGLNEAGVDCAIRIRQWGFIVPLFKIPVNQMNVPGNRAEARRIAREILVYQRNYPGRPVYLVGFSGGGGMSVFAMEALAKYPESRPVEGVVLLSVSLSRDYDLKPALEQTNKGIVNFYNPRDILLLAMGTKLLGNVDGGRAASAGRIGFLTSPPPEAPPSETDRGRLFQVKVAPEMVENPGMNHVASTAADFVSEYVAEWILAERWPPGQEPSRDTDE
jgi:pimeloyl-ACP methyl ester carboxylesterase